MTVKVAPRYDEMLFQTPKADFRSVRSFSYKFNKENAIKLFTILNVTASNAYVSSLFGIV